ncbi:MAG: tetratricopeptide repeat protein [Gemmatimonadales bacterium]
MRRCLCTRRRWQFVAPKANQDAGRTDQAELCYREALAIYRGTEDAHKLDFANAIRPLAILKSNAGQLEAAKPLWEEARERYRTVGVREGVAECSGWLADLEGRCHT